MKPEPVHCTLLVHAPQRCVKRSMHNPHACAIVYAYALMYM